MLHLQLIRENVHENKKFTNGSLFNKDTGERLMYTLEDKVRDRNADSDLLDYKEDKVYGKTAIPYGTYEGFLRFSPSRQRVVPQLKDVKHFEYIQIHAGNSPEDSLGCILVGYKRDEKKGKIWKSRDAERALVKLIESKGEEFNIEIS